jgi:hypothetical protein
MSNEWNKLIKPKKRWVRIKKILLWEENTKIMTNTCMEGDLNQKN